MKKVAIIPEKTLYEHPLFYYFPEAATNHVLRDNGIDPTKEYFWYHDMGMMRYHVEQEVPDGFEDG